MTNHSRLLAVATVCSAVLGALGPTVPSEATALAGQRQLSETGPAGDSRFASANPSLAYNTRREEYLVAWRAGQIDQEEDVYARRVSRGGGPLGEQLRVSAPQPGGHPQFQSVNRPAVAYNPDRDEYLVVWSVDTTGSFNFVVYAQRLNGRGEEIGVDDFALSAPEDAAIGPQVAYNRRTRQYIVVWDGEPGSSRPEIYRLLLDGRAGPLAARAKRISQMRSGGDEFARANAPAVAVDSESGMSLVVWDGVKRLSSPGAREQIYAQRLDRHGNQTGRNDFQVSDPPCHRRERANVDFPSVTFNAHQREWLVVWEGQDRSARFDIWGRRISAGGRGTGCEFQISRTTDVDRSAAQARVAVDPRTNEYFVAWHADAVVEPSIGQEPAQARIYGQPLSSAGQRLRRRDLLLSDMRPRGDPNADAFEPAVGFAGSSGRALVTWYGASSTGANPEFEVFGRALRP